MAPRIHYAIHHEKKQCAVFFAGDEHHAVALPDGWEPLIPRDILRGRAFDAWLRLDNYEKLCRLCPRGYEPLESDWARKSS